MAHIYPMSERPDVDIAEAIEDLIVHYPPLNNDRRHVHVDVVDGVVSLRGYVKTPITHRIFLKQVATVTGVSAINSDNLYNDEQIRIDLGRVIPIGVQANVEWGMVVLSGALPPDITVEALVERLQGIAGVRRVVTALR